MRIITGISKFISTSTALAALVLFMTVGCGKTDPPKTDAPAAPAATPQSASDYPAKATNDTITAGPAATGQPGSTGTTTAAPTGGITGAAAEGQKLFYNAKYGRIKVACSGCHADGQPFTLRDPRLRPAHTLAGVATRTSTWYGMFKGADLKKYAYGAAQCAMAYQKKAETIDKALSPADAASLIAYFTAIQSASGAVPSNLTTHWVTMPQWKEDGPVDEKAAKAATKALLKIPGDAAAGEAVWKHTCQYCHDMTEKKIGPPMKDAAKDMGLVARSLKVGGEAMPFYTSDILTDQQMADVVGYIKQQTGAK